MKNGKPDVLEIISENIQNKPFPAQLDFRISISDRAYKAIIKHAREDQKIEICGILIGEIFKDPNGPYLEISDIIRGEHADNQAGQVMFTHETWEHINSVKDGQFPDKRIVGWYHTHPRFGIFLSDQDVFIHKNFFDKPWQVAFVFDPIQEEEGFFIWRNGVPEKTKHYWLDGKEVVDSEDIKKIEKLLAEKFNSVETEKRDEKSKSTPGYLFFGFSVAVLLMLALIYLFRTEIKTLLNDWIHKSTLLSNQQQNIENKPVTLSVASLIQIINDSKLVQDLTFLGIDPYESKIYFGGEVYTLAQKEEVRKLLLSILKNEGFFDIQKILITHTYTVGPEGESFSQIAEKIYGNPKLGDKLFLYQSYQLHFFDTTKTLSYSRIYLPELK
jgi:proteasome lid subunit RPN8/RPN11